MKAFLQRTVAALATVGLATTAIPKPAMANFTSTPVNQNDFVAVAAPYGEDSYQLLIIEQVSDERKCWEENGENPTTIEPLLLSFNFTGICDRKTDSNGYSIRRNGEDLGLDYILRVVKRGDELVLVGSNRRHLNDPDIVLGSTNGLIEGERPFYKIELDPDWRFAKRTYQGRVLGHVYIAKGESSYTFGDIAGDVYADEIEQAVAMGFVAGFQEDNTFRPEGVLTREQLVSMVLEGLTTLPNANFTLPTQATTRPYPDVEASRWSAAKIQWAKENNIVSGYTDGTFRPTQPVTRAELMAVERRAAEFAQTLQGEPAEITGEQPPMQFSDIQGHWANSLISQMSSYCRVASPLNETGTAFYPNSQARRNYAAAATLRMLNCVKEEETASNEANEVN